MHDNLNIMSSIIVNIIMDEIHAWMFIFYPLFIHIGVGMFPAKFLEIFWDMFFEFDLQ
jgi:hypothetical protein